VAISIEANFTAKKLAEDIRKRQKKNLEIALIEAKTEIIERTQGQRSVEGGQFAKLSDKYAKYKQKKGRRGVPDLTFSGAMLRAIQTKVEETFNGLIGTIFFASTAEAEKARGNMKIRKFFGLSRRQQQKITEKLNGK